MSAQIHDPYRLLEAADTHTNREIVLYTWRRSSRKTIPVTGATTAAVAANWLLVILHVHGLTTQV